MDGQGPQLTHDAQLEPAPLHVPEPDLHEGPATRKPMALWDRVKILLLLALLFGLFVWNDVGGNPILPLEEAVRRQAEAKWWIFWLAGIEVVRQLHYLISEHWAAWHRFWSKTVFGRVDRLSHRWFSDWTRYRMSRVARVLIVILIVDLVLAALFSLGPSSALVEAPARLYTYLPLVMQLAFAFFFVVVQLVGMYWFLSRGGVEVYMPDDIETRFSDVWGQDNVLERVRENIVYLEAPESIEARGGYVPGGILLWGPPGTGKTLMAEAVAGETGKPFVFVEPAAFIQMFMGLGPLKVKSLFRKLRKLALRYGGVIVFFDEADSLGSRGSLSPTPVGAGSTSPFADGPACNGMHYLSPASAWSIMRHDAEAGSGTPGTARQDRIVMGGMGMGGGSGSGVLQALLTELSGMKKPRGFFNRNVRRVLGMRPKPPPKYRMLVMMASNMPQALDEALLRPGRLDRIYKVGYPSKAGRIRTYEGYLAKVTHSLTEADIDKLATITPYATGATIKDLVNEALISALRDGREAIEWRDVVRAKQLKDLGPPEDVEYIERERHAVAIHEACHAVIAHRVRHHLTIDIATIEKGGTYLGMVASIPPEDQFTRWRSEYESDVMVSLASLAGERQFFDGDSSSGVSGDLESATTLAVMMEGYWGMGSTVASHGVTKDIGGGRPGGGGGGRPDDGRERSLLAGSLGDRIESKLDELLLRTERLLSENRLEVLTVAHALETYKTLTGEDVAALIEGRPGPLVDGTPYRDPRFLADAEAYHALAVEAHRSHASTTLRLPAVPTPGSVPTT